jgi:hypothetical protein
MCPANCDLIEYKRIDLKSTAQVLSTSFADLGAEIPCFGYRYACVYLEVDINQAADVVVGALGKLEAAATNEYWLPIQATGTAEINVDKLEYEINYDADGLQMFRIDVTGVPYLQLQAKERTDGGTDADIEHVVVLLVK